MAKSRRSLAARADTGATDYDERKHGEGENLYASFDRSLNPGIKNTRMMPPVSDGGMCLFRIIPPIYPPRPDALLLPGRLRDGSPSLWSVRCTMASYVGIGEKASWILYHPALDQDAKNHNPYRRLEAACYRANKAGNFGQGNKWDSEWNKLMKGGKEHGKGYGACISNVKGFRFLQCFMYANGEECFVTGQRELPLGMAENDPIVVTRISEGAGVSLFDMLATEKPEWEGDPGQDPSLPFFYGDPVGRFDAKTRTVRGGIFVGVFRPRRAVRELPYRYTSWDGKVAEVQGYEIALWPAVTIDHIKYTPDLGPGAVDAVFERIQFWFDGVDANGQVSPGLLYIPPVEEQCAIIARCFKEVPRLVAFAWQEDPHFMTDEVKGILRQRVTSVTPPPSEDYTEYAEDGTYEGAPEDGGFGTGTPEAAPEAYGAPAGPAPGSGPLRALARPRPTPPAHPGAAPGRRSRTDVTQGALFGTSNAAPEYDDGLGNGAAAPNDLDDSFGALPEQAPAEEFNEFGDEEQAMAEEAAAEQGDAFGAADESVYEDAPEGAMQPTARAEILDAVDDILNQTAPAQAAAQPAARPAAQPAARAAAQPAARPAARPAAPPSGTQGEDPEARNRRQLEEASHGMAAAQSARGRAAQRTSATTPPPAPPATARRAPATPAAPPAQTPARRAPRGGTTRRK